MFNPRVNTTFKHKKISKYFGHFLTFQRFFSFFGGVTSRPPPQHFETNVLLLLRECMREIFRKLGEFVLGRCEDIASVRYQKFGLLSGLPLFPFHNFQHISHFNIEDRPKRIHIFFIILSGKNMLQNEC